ncbi:alkaline phosphatase family protein [Sutcliffiella horikoshii]|uniref:alkaline phosphatase family protein n=1 Tax=Sutcliffiella horikoshii TaxID=79883 RepID=UPI001F38B035|nr:alkaline phosphatase family protein [Sutcliffiella horikoshii]MCG1023399.1 alkaline phosphatase family protein [Sutcliffiella horikoshii]
MKILLLIMLCTASLLTACQDEKLHARTPSEKKIIMIMVDSMTDELLDETLKSDEFPALRFFMSKGQVYPDLVAPFPSMSVAIEGTIITGEMPYEHKVPGLTWYDPKEDRIIDYGTSFETLRKLGFKESLEDAYYRLNNVHLNKKSTTIFEELQEKGISSGAINTLLYRGKTKHLLQTPLGLNKLIGIDDEVETYGPDIFSFGSFHRPAVLEDERLPDALILRAGFTDNYAAEVIKKLIITNQQPQFLFAFFPEMDKKTHRNSPPYVKGFKEVDHHLQEILDVYENWDDALEDNIFILFGDHGQASLAEDEEDVKINLHELYGDYHIAPFKEKPSTGDIVISNNHRSAFLYPTNKDVEQEEIALKAMEDKRIALAATDIDDWFTVWAPEVEESFRFKKDGEWTDSFGQSWTIEGPEEVLALTLDHPSKTISYTEYPDALNQLSSAILSQPGSVVVTAKPGHITFSETAPVHDGGGEHGGINKDDTLAALIIAGTDKEPTSRRMVDLKGYVLDLLKEE